MGNLFWPVLLIIAGGLLLVRNLFNINLPVVKILLAVALLWGGITLISASATKSPVIFGSRMELSDTTMEYTVMFDSSEIDLSNETITREQIEIDCVLARLYSCCQPIAAFISRPHGSVLLAQIAGRAYDNVWRRHI